MAAPKGNKNAARASDWKNAIKWALENYQSSAIERGQALRGIGLRLVDMALDGDMQAIKEVGDRLDGKPAQTVHGTMTHAIAATELTDEQLASIAAGGSPGASTETDSSQELH